MENNKLTQIIKDLNDNRSKLSALFSLYNSSLIVAEDTRQALSNYYEQMIDFKNDLNAITTQISECKKTERAKIYDKNKSKIKKLNVEASSLNNDFSSACKKYRVALKECGSLKSEYKHTVSELCKEFKANVTEDTEPVVIRGYKQQVKVIKAILEKIEMIVADYNVKKNRVEDDSSKFTQLYESVNDLITRLNQIA